MPTNTISSVLTPFKSDSALSSDQLDSLREITIKMNGRAESHARSVVERMVLDGNDLMTVKAMLPGRWMEWFAIMQAQHLIDYSIEKAQDLMAVAQLVGDNLTKFDGLKGSFLIEMARHSTPTLAVQRILELHAGGEKLTGKVVNQIIDEEKVKLLPAPADGTAAAAETPAVSEVSERGLVKTLEEVLAQSTTGFVDVNGEPVTASPETIAQAVREALDERAKRQAVHVESGRKTKAGASTSAEREYVARNFEITVSPKGNIRLPDEMNEAVQTALQQNEVVGGRIYLSLYYFKEAIPSVTAKDSSSEVDLEQGVDITR